MTYLRFGIRDLLWAMVVVGLILGWSIHWRSTREARQLQRENEVLRRDYNALTVQLELQGYLSFNWRIIQAPMIVVDYLIVHELAHILEPNHSQDFWNIVAVHVPSWVKAKSWLKQHGGCLEW